MKLSISRACKAKEKEKKTASNANLELRADGMSNALGWTVLFSRQQTANDELISLQKISKDILTNQFYRSATLAINFAVHLK